MQNGFGSTNVDTTEVFLPTRGCYVQLYPLSLVAKYDLLKTLKLIIG